MNKVILFTQNLILNSFEELKSIINDNDNYVILTTHYLFQNEREYLGSLFKNVEFRTFSDFLDDSEMEFCDSEAYRQEKNDYAKYLSIMKSLKNEKIFKNLKKELAKFKGYILSNDLGIDEKFWIKKGFKRIKGKYYYIERIPLLKKVKHCLGKVKLFRDIYFAFKRNKKYSPNADELYVSEYNGKKIIFIGKMHRIAYRLNLEFKKSEEELEKYNNNIFYKKEECQYITTLHEMYRLGCNIPDTNEYDIRYIQDGYLPPNHSEFGYNFIPANVKYYAWDVLGEQLFFNKNLPVSIMPFRKKLYLETPNFPKEIKNILIVASGSGDWTAQKNRSDDDILVDAFVKMAKKYPNINFVYRCHPTWIHPQNVGVNSINRVVTYFKYKNLPNLKLSSSIPPVDINNYQMSFSRSSLEEDLKNTDFVFGEHSISMIDAAFKKIPFCSVNLTNRRNLFCGISDLGFPHAESLDEIINVVENITKENYQNEYFKAIEKYNQMTESDDL